MGFLSFLGFFVLLVSATTSYSRSGIDSTQTKVVRPAPQGPRPKVSGAGVKGRSPLRPFPTKRWPIGAALLSASAFAEGATGRPAGTDTDEHRRARGRPRPGGGRWGACCGQALRYLGQSCAAGTGTEGGTAPRPAGETGQEKRVRSAAPFAPEGRALPRPFRGALAPTRGPGFGPTPWRAMNYPKGCAYIPNRGRP